MTAIIFSNAIGPVPITCFIKEQHRAELEITEIPIEFGAAITDHAYAQPKKVTLDIADANAAASHAALVRHQESREPFTLVTGLSVYRNMLIKRIEATRESTSSRILRASVDLQEVIIVETAKTAGDGDGEGARDAKGQPGGKKSTKSAGASKGRAGDAATADRASSTVGRGDAGTKTVPEGKNQSGAFQAIFGSR